MSWQDDNTESEFEIQFEDPENDDEFNRVSTHTGGRAYSNPGGRSEDEYGYTAGNDWGEAQPVEMTGGHDAAAYEKDFFKIYDQARQYRMRIKDVENQKGGEEKKKRTLNETMKLMSTIAKKLQESGKYPDINRPLFMRVAKMIVDKAKENVNAPTKVNAAGKTVRELTPAVNTEALKLTENPDKYITIVRGEKAEKERAKGLSSSSNSRSNRNMRKVRDDDSDGDRADRNLRNSNSKQTFEEAYSYPSKNNNSTRNSRGSSSGSDSRYQQLNRYGEDEGYQYKPPRQAGGTAVFY
ncbi:Hypothetical protein MVR_LOCUS43 [uncultured virus]|nr:Hypothetical protein MVR_LOCUS43 [uncultured virus]